MSRTCLMYIWLLSCLLTRCFLLDPQGDFSLEEHTLAKSYLNKFGYLKCRIPESNQTSCSNENYLTAYRQLQKNFGLSETGFLDADTLSVIKMNRCGNTDEQLTVSEQHVQDQGLNETNEMERAEQQDEGANLTKSAFSGPTERPADGDINNLLRGVRTIRGTPLISRVKRSVAAVSHKDGDRKTITWTLITDGGNKDWQVVAVKMALEMWSDVIPVRFVNKNIVEVNIIFLITQRAGTFDSYTQNAREGDRKYIRIYIEDLTAYNHFDLDLIHVLVHNIGHCLGLGHDFSTDHVMYPIYKKGILNEISREERTKVQQIYGICKGSFDNVVDWQWPDGQTYTTFFYRGGKMWKYSNQDGKPEANVQSGSSPFFVDADAVLQVVKRGKPMENYVFRGQKYYAYRDGSLTIGYPKIIKEDLSCASVTGPEKVDASFSIDDLVYLFNDDKVWIYSLLDFGKNDTCPIVVDSFAEIFNNSTGESFRVDSIFYSFALNKIIIFMGEDLYAVEVPNEKNDRGFLTGQLIRLGHWYDFFHDVC